MTARETREYQRGQVALRALTYKDVAVLWRTLDLEKLDATFPRFATAVLVLIAQRRETSAALARTYIAKLRAGVEGKAPAIPTPTIPTEDVLASLRAKSVIGIKVAMTRGTPLDMASKNALVNTMGAVDKYVGDAGRGLILQSVATDPAASGWVRRSLGTCDFCALLAGKTNNEGETFPRHDHCGCQPEPVYDVGAQTTAPLVHRLVEFYGDRMQVTGSGAVVKQHLDDLSEFSEGTHSTLREHFRSVDGGGFYIGDEGVPELDDLGHLRGVHPRGWAEGDTWDTVPGAYDPTRRVCACGGGGHGHGSTSLALHEGSHALDDALGSASRSTEFVEAYHDLHGIAGLNPYYTHPGNPSGYLSEGFAEGFAAYSRHRTEGRDALIDALSNALQGNVATGPQTRASFGRLVDYFSGLERSRLSK